MNRAQVPVFGTGGNRAQVPVDGTGANQAQFPVLEPGGNRVQAPISGTGGNQRPDDQVEDSKAVLCWTKHGEFRCTARSKTTDKRYMFTKIPIQEPLLRLQNSELTELILECFVCIMKFMGDYPMKDNQTEYDCVLRILRTCHNYPELTDEIYCQLCKQMTNNRNMKSCVLGWRLFSIVACYSDCSYKLWPHLKAYIETTSSDTSSTFSKPASICLHNLQQTKKYGGRQNIPTKPEITALSDGRLTQRYTFTFRGSETQGMLQVGPSMVVRDAVEDICNRLDIFDQVEMEEYTLSICTKGETTPQFVGLKSEEYILDVTGEMVRRNQEFSLVFQRIVWLFPYRETDNILYNKLMFFQCLPDYSDGRLVQNRHLSGLVEEDVALLGALLYKAFDRGDMPTIQDLPSLLPNVVRQLPGYHPSPWLHKIQRHMTTANRLGPLNCMAKFVAILSRWTLFGSTFFAVEEPMIGHCILMVNKNGLHALHSNTHSTWIKMVTSKVDGAPMVKSVYTSMYATERE